MNEKLLNKIEEALGIKLFKWQKQYLLKEPMVLDMRITGRATGKTLVWIIEKLFESKEPLVLRDGKDVLISSDWWCCENRRDRALYHPYMSWYKNHLKDIYEKLNDAEIKTREVIF